MTNVLLPTRHYDLAATLDSGQAFRWHRVDGAWEGVVRGCWVRLRQDPGGIHAHTATSVQNWGWLREYLQIDVDLDRVLAHFPGDEPMRRSVSACHGLRLLRQDSWECLASFILSSCKQIVQIRQIIGMLCSAYGDRLKTPPGHAPVHGFPTPEQILHAGEEALRRCKMGWRARSLLGASREIVEGRLSLDALTDLEVDAARERLTGLPGVGPKIANCVLLFAYGFQEAFPVDVWVQKAIRQLYFPKRRPTPARLRAFASGHFGPYAGYAQQYLFHYMRTRHLQTSSPI